MPSTRTGFAIVTKLLSPTVVSKMASEFVRLEGHKIVIEVIIGKGGEDLIPM